MYVSDKFVYVWLESKLACTPFRFAFAALYYIHFELIVTVRKCTSAAGIDCSRYSEQFGLQVDEVVRIAVS